MPKRHVRRSGLTMPVNNPRFLNAVWTRGCDFVNLDLEDSVPESQKPQARTLIKSAIPTAAKGGAEVFVRINHDYVEADLEDGVPPALKSAVRSGLREAITLAGRGGAEVFVRVNKPYLAADLAAATWPGLTGIMLPKIESGAEGAEAATLMTDLERQRGIEVGALEAKQRARQDTAPLKS